MTYRAVGTKGRRRQRISSSASAVNDSQSRCLRTVLEVAVERGEGRSEMNFQKTDAKCHLPAMRETRIVLVVPWKSCTWIV